MTYATSNPPALVSQRVGANGGAIWIYKDGDSLDDVGGINYVHNAGKLGIKAGDRVIHIDSTDSVTTDLTAVAHRTSGTASGALGGAIEPIGETSINLSSDGTGTVLIGDIVYFDNDPDSEYEITTGDADISGGATLVITPGLITATAVGTGMRIKSGVINLSTQKAGLKVISGEALATRLLLPAESGAICYFDKVAGITYTLPVGVVGMKYTFVTTVTLTSGAYAVLANTDTAGDFFVGPVSGAIEGAATDEMHFANGTTHLGISSNKTTTGGLLGGIFTLECIAANLWRIEGVVSCTTTPATPFTT